jgi:hypothetical protein
MTIDGCAVPDENVIIYRLLYDIEVGLREFIIEALESKCGSRWWKERLPSDVLTNFREGRKCERNITWCRLIPHHPMHYTDFPDLRKVIERRDNWKDVFQPILKRKEILTSTLSELEPIRNTVAHNRKATEEDLHIVKAAYQKITTAIGEERFLRLVSKSTTAEDLPQIVLQLRMEAESAFRYCTACKPLVGLEVWKRTQASWWFDAEYLGHRLSAIKECFDTLVAYSQLPRSRGCGYKIEEWVKSKDIEEKYIQAMQEFSELLDNL